MGPRPIRTRAARLASAIGVGPALLLLLAAICAPLFLDGLDRSIGRARDGVVDLSGLEPHRAVELTGGWSFRWRGPGPERRATLAVPGPWDRDGFPPQGFGTYALRITGLPRGEYALHFPPPYTAQRVRVDGAPASTSGVIGRTPVDTLVALRAHDAVVAHRGGDLRLEVDVAAFPHRDNGMEEIPVFGRREAMARWTALDWLRGSLFLVPLLLVGVMSLVVFAFRRDDRASLFLAASLFFAVPVALGYSHDHLLAVLWPNAGLSGVLFIQYACGIGSVAAFALYVERLFPAERSRFASWIVLAGFGALLVAEVVFFARGDTRAMSWWSKGAEPLRFATFGYVLGVAALATWRGRPGAATFLVGTAVLVAAIAATGLQANGIARAPLPEVDLPALGSTVFLLAQVVILAERWAADASARVAMAEERRRLLEIGAAITGELRLDRLLAKIVGAASAIVRADRSSLFLHDPATGTLGSVVAEGTADAIRFGGGEGLAGHSFTTGEPSHVVDAYADPRFNPAVDRVTGFRTGSVVTVPVETRGGGRLGVLQALADARRPFAPQDIDRMAAFAAQAAVAIENATLFADVNAARRRNGDILDSMSSAVVTLERGGEARLNRAGRAMLGADALGLSDTDAVAELQRRNEWLAADIVQAGGQKSYADIELEAATGRRLSVNVALVPLRRSEEAIGLLVMVDDITGEKRLKGTMRRFLSPQVIEEVLGRDDDALFGASTTASVLFADIRGFTTLSERLSPRETVETLNRVFTDLYDAVADAGGVLDKYLGDAVMAVFGAPIARPGDAGNAVGSALAMLRAAAAHGLRLGAGIATGEVVAGTIGSPKRMEYTVIGDSVNLAARLQDLTKWYGVELLVCGATAAALPTGFPMRELDLIRVRGRRGATRLFQVFHVEHGTAPDPASIEHYAEGRARMVRGEWEGAAAAFAEASRADPEDRPALLMRDRAERLAGLGWPADWDGVWDQQ